MPKTVITKLQEDPDYLKKNARSRSKNKKGRFKKISFKITDTQRQALEVISKRQNTTPVRYIKSIISKQTSKYKTNNASETYVTENQLSLFD